MRTKLSLLLTLIVAALAVICLPASGTPGKEVICHPNNGASAWSVIDVSQRSIHFADDGTPKHTAKDGRTDVLAADGVCPGEVTPTTPPTTEPTTPPVTEPTTPVETTEPTPTEPTTPTEPPGTTTVPTTSTTTSTTTTDSPPPATTVTATLAPPVVSTRPPTDTTNANTPKPQVPTAFDAGLESTGTQLPNTGGVHMRLLALGLGLAGLGLVVLGVLGLRRNGARL